MHFYRPLGPVKALTFDLDDTLYDNRPVMAKTEQEVLAFLQQRYPELSHMQVADFRQLRNELRAQEPEIYHDVSHWRWRSLHSLLLGLGYADSQARQGATDAMAHFSHWRSQVDVPQETHNTLRQLAERFPLAAITNGNAQPQRFGLDGYFQFVLTAGADGRAKPYDDMYSLAAERLGLAPEEILHVGDDLITDVAGAVESGLQACWINDRQRNLMQEPDARVLPHIEISRLASLLTLS